MEQPSFPFPGVTRTMTASDLLRALKAAMLSLDAISRLAGEDEFLADIEDIRGYANSRADVARSTIKKWEGELIR